MKVLKSQKVEYKSKKDCISKLNYLKKELGKFELRPYEENGKWYLTHTKDPNTTVIPSARDLINVVSNFVINTGSDDDKAFIKKLLNKVASIEKLK
jgi:hypothetical protein